ncbi:MAG: ABC transporter permease [Alphaproteobacteria bacterium]|nr:ABC transporter permease [Alphaproteobacteria bacterium]
MNLFTLSLSYIRARTLTSTLLVVLLALGVATISLLLHFNHQAEERLSRDARGFDLVVGAKGSPLQLILSSIYHIDIPTGNIPITEAENLRKHKQIKQAIPLALGDSYRGFRIVGTEASYIKHYQAELAEGEVFTKPMQAVVGARVAAETGLKMNASFAGSHGLTESDDVHADTPYHVVGVLKPTGTVLDRLIITPVESVWKVHGSEAHQHHGEHKEEAHEEHEHHDEHEHEKHADHDENKHEKHGNDIEASDEITALLITFNSKIAAMSLPREINRGTSMQAASPAFETARLLSLLGMGLDTLKFFGALLMASAVIGMLVAIYQSMQERKYDAALMRVMGASRGTLVKQILIEAGLLLAAGIIGGLLMSHLTLAALPMLAHGLKDIGFAPLHFLTAEISVAVGLFVAGLLVALLPALAAYRVDVSRTLARG